LFDLFYLYSFYKLKLLLMKNLKKLTRDQLEKVNGAGEIKCVTTCFCFTDTDGEAYIGACNTKGVCC